MRGVENSRSSRAALALSLAGVMAGVAGGCGAATDPEIGVGPFGAACEGTMPCVPPGTIVSLWRRGVAQGVSAKVTIFADGRVAFERSAGMGPPERHERSIGTADLSSLLWRLDAADFFSLRDRYDGAICDPLITDADDLRLTVDVESRHKDVDWYLGCGGPEVRPVALLAQAVEDTAGHDEWTDGTW